ncbi:MAG TPA: HDOD domain-containing protein [Terriglobales bacterium]|jgi:putative nucleotidyltransferase with HDIG domain
MNQPWSLLRLPPFPPLALQVMRMVSRDDVSMKELSELISADQVFASEILMIANSPLYQSSREITSILQATTLLGLERMKGLTVMVGVRAYLGDWFNLPSLRACWRHSVACALIAEKLAAAAHMDRDVCYTAGLIHDIGRLGLAALYPMPYSRFLEATEKNPCDILQRERELFSCDHCEAGRHLVEAWKLPNSLAEVVSRHHESRMWREDDVLSIVHLSCRMADSLGFAAAHNLNASNYEDLLAQIPQEEQGRFSAKTEEMTLLLAAQINAVESM